MANSIYEKISPHQREIFDEAQVILRTPSDDWSEYETTVVLDMIAIHDEHDCTPIEDMPDKLDQILDNIEGIGHGA